MTLLSRHSTLRARFLEMEQVHFFQHGTGNFITLFPIFY